MRPRARSREGGARLQIRVTSRNTSPTISPKCEKLHAPPSLATLRCAIREHARCCDVASPALRQSQAPRPRAQGRVFSVEPRERAVLLPAAAPGPPALARDSCRPLLGGLRPQSIAQISPAGALATASFHARRRGRRRRALVESGRRIRRLAGESGTLGAAFPSSNRVRLA